MVFKRLKSLVLKVIPGGIFTTSKLFGVGHLIAMFFKMAWGYKRTFFYLLRKKGIRAAYNFFYTKVFVPTGEGAGAAWYFIAGPIVRRYPSLAPFPRYVEIEVTTICNRRCIMCEHTFWKDRVERHLSFEEFKHIFDQFHGIKWVHLTGEGSAFLNKDYPKMLEYAKSKDVCTYLVDHLNDANEELLRELIRLGIDGVYISIDGATRETYNQIRIGCDFDRAIDNTRKLIELKQQMKTPIPEICFRYIILTPNVHEMPKFVDLVASFGDRKTLGDGSRLDFVGNLEFKEVKHLSVYKIPEHILEETMTKAREHDIHVFLSHIEPTENPPIKQCIAWLEPYVMMGGYVIPCCNILMSNKREILRQHSFGNLFEKSFREIWYSERYKRFREILNKEDEKVPYLCTLCRAYDFSERLKKYGVDKEL